MNTIQPASPAPQAAPLAFNYDAWIAEDAKRRAAFADELVQLKASLFDTLEAHGIVFVTVSFDGCGDSGQIEGISAFDEHGEVALPEFDTSEPETDPDVDSDSAQPQPLADAIEALSFDLLESEHGGWEINEGAYGEFRFDVAGRSITLGCHMRVETTEFSETCW